MTREELGTRIRAIISDHLASTYRGDRGTREVTDASILVEDPAGNSLQLDSLDLVECTMAIEDQFDVELNDEEMADLITVADVIGHVAGVLGLVEAEAT